MFLNFLKHLIFHKNEGSTMVETMMAAVILAAVGTASLKIVGNYNLMSINVGVKQSQGFEVSKIVGTISNNAKFLQADYSNKTADEIFEKKGLPMAWDTDVEPITLEKCIEISKKFHERNDCYLRGRYGIVIKPVSSFNGLQIATIRISHSIIYKDQKFKTIKKLIYN